MSIPALKQDAALTCGAQDYELQLDVGRIGRRQALLERLCRSKQRVKPVTATVTPRLSIACPRHNQATVLRMTAVAV